MIKNVKSITLSYTDDEEKLHEQVRKVLRDIGYNIGPKFKWSKELEKKRNSDPYLGSYIQEKEITFEDVVSICKAINDNLPNVVIDSFYFGTTSNDYNWLDYDTLELEISIKK